MTNLDKIRSMNDEELIDFLSKYIVDDSVSELAPGYCDERCPYAEKCEGSAVIDCWISDRDIIAEWGKKEI